MYYQIKIVRKEIIFYRDKRKIKFLSEDERKHYARENAEDETCAGAEHGDITNDFGSFEGRINGVVRFSKGQFLKDTISAGWRRTVGLKSDGTVVAVGDMNIANAM
ncbi:RCC1-like domain-containing protein [Paenibacillus dendritiformis]|uniref:RCC1-like domain-containing protein n=1 Tax=Paenibacillus dendritiformis TaxID=130049 RepID=UPI003CC82D14